jgi:L-rhamnose isomerase
MPAQDLLLQSATQTLPTRKIESAFAAAKDRFAALGVDAEAAVRTALAVPISVHCWQADDVKGLEAQEGVLDGGGIQATGNYPGAARTGDEIRADFDVAARLIPGALRFNLHAMYAETEGKRVDRDALEPAHFSRWIAWAKDRGYGLDFNPSCFAHPMVKDGLTLSSESKRVRDFWIAHCLACRKIARAMAKELGPSVCNIWIPDGRKDSTADRWGPRARLVRSLDEVLKTKMPGVVDSVEAKLFGIGCEDYTVGSHEFYLAYAVSRKVVPCYDLGHFHPTESIADKLSATLLFTDRLLIHASRGIRWDSDHVTRFNDEVKALCDEAARGKAIQRIYWALDYFDASINRVGAWVIGARTLRKALLNALLEPFDLTKHMEYAGRGAEKLALVEYRAELPFGAVWDYACLQADTPTGLSWVRDMNAYEAKVLSKR